MYKVMIFLVAMGGVVLMLGFGFMYWMAYGFPSKTPALDEATPASVSFSINEDVGTETASVVVYFSGPEGFQPLGPGSSIAVNKVPPEKHEQHGGSSGSIYLAEIEKADQYELQYRRGENTPEVTHSIEPRIFIPEMPSVVSIKNGVVIHFEGPPISEGERVIARISGGVHGTKTMWEKVLSTMIRPSEIVISSDELTNQRFDTDNIREKLGPATLFIGIVSYQGEKGSDDELSFYVGREVGVQITE